MLPMFHRTNATRAQNHFHRRLAHFADETGRLFRCAAILAHIGEVQLRLAQRQAVRAEAQRMERAEFGPQTRESLDP